MPGWDEDITGARSWDDLPGNAVKYLKRIEEISGVKIGIVSVGPDRVQTF
jgi:adenylosuccinate synthase